MDSGLMLATGVLAVAAFIVTVAVVAAFFAFSGPHRGALVALSLPLALVLPVAAVSYASFSAINAFKNLAAAGGGGADIVTAEMGQSWTVVRLGLGAAIAVGLVSMILGLVPARERLTAVRLSTRRAFVLLVLPFLALALSAELVRQLHSAVRVAVAVVQPGAEEGGERRAAVERVLESEGLGAAMGSGGIAVISNHLARATILGSVGGLALVVVLAGLALTGGILGARVRAGGGFVAAASGLWLLALVASAAVALGLGDPLRIV